MLLGVLFLLAFGAVAGLRLPHPLQSASADTEPTVVYVGNGWFCPTPESCPQPYEVKIPEGGTVRWEWVEGTHTTTACADETHMDCGEQHGWDSGPLSTGATFEYTFSEQEEGDTVHYVCTLHLASHFGAVSIDDGSEPEPTPTPAPPTPPADGYELVDSGIGASFSAMVDFVPVPGSPEEALVLRQTGQIHRIWLDNSQASQTVADLSTRADPSTAVLFDNSEDGLLSLAFDPRFPNPPHVYVYYSRPPPPGLRPPCLDEYVNNPDIDRPYHSTNVLSRFTVDPVTLVLDEDSEEEVLVLPDRRSWHNGGGLLFGPDDGYLYLSLGDEGGFSGVGFNSIYFDPCWNAQDTSTLWGSVIRIDVLDQETYAIPGDNPLVGKDGLDEIWAWGFRNPWRMNLDEETGDLWIGDVGQSHYEEVNRVVKGGNYGWAVFEGNRCWDDSREEFDRCDDLEDYQPPRWEYCRRFVPLAQCPSGDVYYQNEGYHLDCSVIGGHVYRGSRFPELYGWYVYADYCSGRVRALDTSSPDSPSRVLVEAFDSEPARFISAVEKTPDGELLFVSYNNNGFYRLQRLCGFTPLWHVPEGDYDCDGWTDEEELAIGTDPYSMCGVDAWPPDINNDGVVDITDLGVLLPPVFGRTSAHPEWNPRLDLQPDGVIDIIDIGRLLPPVFGVSCAP